MEATQTHDRNSLFDLPIADRAIVTAYFWLILSDRQDAFMRADGRPAKWERIKGEFDECWIWPGSQFTNGYGRIKRRGVCLRAHRISYEIHNGPMPEGSVAMHSCDTPACVNPAHISAGTPADNMLDAQAKGRLVTGDDHWTRQRPEDVLRGQRHGRTSLTASDVIALRRRAYAGESYHALSADYGITYGQVYRIATGQNWTHLLDGETR